MRPNLQFLGSQGRRAGLAYTLRHQGLVAFWPLQEAGGLVSDVVGSLHLTNVNGVTYDSVQEAARFIRSSNQRLTHIDTPALNPTGTFTLSFFCRKSTATTSAQRAIAKWQVTPENDRTFLATVTTGMVFSVHDNTTAAGVSGMPMTDEVWYHFIMENVASTHIRGYQDGVASTAAHSLVLYDGVADFAIGGESSGVNHLDGWMKNIGLWNRTLTNEERSFLQAGWTP
jgi:hypothetical protein